MKTRKKRGAGFWILMLFLGVLLGLTAYFITYPKKLAKVILPDFSKVEEVDGLIRNDSLHLNARGLFESQTPLPLIIDSLWYQFYVEDCVLYSQRKKVALNLVLGETDTVNIGIHVPFDRIRNISKYIKPMDSVMIGVQCEVAYKYFGQHIRLEFKKEGKIPRPVPPRIQLAGIEKKKISDWGKSIETEARLKVINDNKRLNVTVHELKYNIQIGDKIVGRGRYPNPVVLKPQTTIVVPIPVSLQVDKPLKTAWQLVFEKDKVPYTLRASGLVDFHGKKQPPIRVELETTGETDFSMKKGKNKN